MFYGAFDEETALLETYVKREEEPAKATIATFETAKPMRVVNLTKLPAIPSIFDSDKRWMRPGATFLRAFVKDISQPIEKDGREHIEYVPTQIVTEYFRRIYADEDGEAVRGILYPSARNDGGVSCVLFFENANCCDRQELKEGQHQWLVLDEIATRTLGES